MLPPSSIVKEASTGLWVGWSLKFMLSEHEMMLFVFPDVDRGRVIVTGDEPLRAHLEDPQNMTYKFDGSSIELLERGAFFSGMHSDRNDKVSPVTAVFDLSWRLFAQKNGEDEYLIDSGSHEGGAHQGAFFPEELASAHSSGHVHWKLNFSDLDSVFKEHGDGWYLITMNGHLRHSFYSWSGNWTTEEIDYTFFTINCTYIDGAHTWMEIYYPLPLFVKTVQITHPLLVGFKLNASTVVGVGVTLSVISSGGYYYYLKKQKKPTQQNITQHMHQTSKS
jgi:hypothetical protein